ncbi:YhfX family PLP-dependent enzyme, partial [Salmonella enterica subsp. enterica]|nr:YhfX family PLP-dependent enzyme [Salmonella enterica subsp. enterica serovar Oranienburg]
MFIEALKSQNPALILAAYELWQQGVILPDTYVIDVDQVIENGRRLLTEAENHDIKLYLMTKQFGRNPWLAKRLIELGFHGTVSVDFKEARMLRRSCIPVSHVGHLVQVPTSLISEIVSAPTEIITVFSLEKAREISVAALQYGHSQPIMLKFFDDQDKLFPGQEAGFPLSALDDVVRVIRTLPGVKIAGLTHFPCLLWSEEQQKTLPTPNLQ